MHLFNNSFFVILSRIERDAIFIISVWRGEGVNRKQLSPHSLGYLNQCYGQEKD